MNITPTHAEFDKNHPKTSEQDKQIDIAAKQILEKYKKAFLELAK